MSEKIKKLTAIILSVVVTALSCGCSTAAPTDHIPEDSVISSGTADDTEKESSVSDSAPQNSETASDTVSDEEDTEKTTSAAADASETTVKIETNTSAAETVSESATTAEERVPTAETNNSPAETTPPKETSVTTAAVSENTTATQPTHTAAVTTTTAAVTTITAAITTAATTTSAAPAETSQTVTEVETNIPASSLSNPNASEAAKKLYQYISDTYGKAIISGQQESTWMGSDQYEFDYIFGKTGKYPAIRGLDYMNDDFKGVNKRAKEWYDKGGIVTICWHCGCDFSGSWSECMETELSDWNAVLTEGTKEYDAFIAGTDKAAKALKELKEQNIPVLWRPFHEFDGGWFWWGKGGAENFKKLWKVMYDRYTNYWGLDNLIWVCGFSGNGTDYDKWYPGDSYVDIAGADSYTEGANANLYNLVKNTAGENIPICFHECGRIPTAEQLKTGKANWVWFMTWHTEFITDKNDVDDLKNIFNDPYVITLDELPDLY